MKSKKTLRIIAGVVIFLTLPCLLFFGFVYIKYNTPIPNGAQDDEADTLAYKMLEALNYTAYKNTDYIEWTYNKKHHYQWKKNKNRCNVYWKEYRVDLDLKDYSQSQAYVHSFKLDNDLAHKLIKKALFYFNNDSFWLVAPYTVFNEGVERRLVTLNNKEKGLLVTYTKGGNTPGDSYLWLLDDTYKPKAFNIWTSALPFEGLEASWSDWITTESGALLPTFHKLLVLGIKIDEIKGTK